MEKFKGAKILVAGDNFGCGSSREHAVWALMDFGFRVVISSSFADIFYNNCFKNGLLPIKLEQENYIKIIGDMKNKNNILTINLNNQTISSKDIFIKFDIDDRRKEVLVNGIDDISETLKLKNKIIEYENKQSNKTTWVFNEK